MSAELHVLPAVDDVVAVEGVAGQFRVAGVVVDGSVRWVQLHPIAAQTSLRVEASRLRKVRPS